MNGICSSRESESPRRVPPHWPPTCGAGPGRRPLRVWAQRLAGGKHAVACFNECTRASVNVLKLQGIGTPITRAAPPGGIRVTAPRRTGSRSGPRSRRKGPGPGPGPRARSPPGRAAKLESGSPSAVSAAGTAPAPPAPRATAPPPRRPPSRRPPVRPGRSGPDQRRRGSGPGGRRGPGSRWDVIGHAGT